MFLVNVPDSHQEMGLMIMFNLKLEADFPLGIPEKLMSKEFPIPVSIMFGDVDWVRGLEAEAAAKICKISKFQPFFPN